MLCFVLHKFSGVETDRYMCPEARCCFYIHHRHSLLLVLTLHFKLLTWSPPAMKNFTNLLYLLTPNNLCLSHTNAS